MAIEAQGSVRVDLLGGTLDLNPINVILPNVYTINLATSLKAVVRIDHTQEDGVRIKSLDYKSEHFFSREQFIHSLQAETFKELYFVALILDYFRLHSKVVIELVSGSPTGAGLGGSSAMGVTLFKAVCLFLNKECDREEAIRVVNNIEARMLDCGPAGYQDYYPALYGGVLALSPDFGKVKVEQLFSKELKAFLESHLTLVYSGETRLSGINNWEVYKAFFNKDEKVRQGLSKISEHALVAYQSIVKNDLPLLLKSLCREGEERVKLFPGIMTPNMLALKEKLLELNLAYGLKVCGAGGGGCFLIAHHQDHGQKIKNFIEDFNKVHHIEMRVLNFEVEGSL